MSCGRPKGSAMPSSTRLCQMAERRSLCRCEVRELVQRALVEAQDVYDNVNDCQRWPKQKPVLGGELVYEVDIILLGIYSVTTQNTPFNIKAFFKVTTTYCILLISI